MFNYRAWSKSNEEYFKVKRIDFVNERYILENENWDGEVGTHFDNIILEPGTGIEDITGKEIFLNDVVVIFGEYFKVIWLDKHATFGFQEFNGHETRKLYKNSSRNYRIVGNIHEER